ncbi:probable RNA-binding protein ARP1 isoform X1 [Zingiber officinale]|uniref:probable RNA-binding protein ARP1 isoform X1 n=1 Tax=Zingiber officinale TaxID=94328 RepID=UPI001C4DB531|nr:probable RNA-binding protein ARP1 isoform X1 [Zingiber officinale]
MGQQFVDTTLTKVFVGGLAWEMQKEALREHFEKYGEILEAVVISDKISGRSKGYGFVTFKEAEAAKRACEDAAPVIDGRRANCNLASLGAKRGGVGIRHSPPSAPAPFTSRGGQQPPPGMAVGSRVASPAPPAAQWYYPNPARTPPPPFQLHQYPHGLIPFYSADAYSPNYTNFPNNSKLSPSGGGGGFYQGQFAYPAAAANGMLPMYPLFHWHPHQSQGMALPTAHFFPTSPTAAIPTIISTKPTAIPPPVSVCVAVEQVKGAN